MPQGSVISCTLFSLAINNMLKNIPQGIKSSLYVDDLLIYVSGVNQPSLERRLQLGVNRVNDWAETHGFKFSSSKTESILFHRKKKLLPSPQLFLNQRPIPARSTIKYLGMLFDEKLNWKDHLKMIKMSCSKHLDLLKCISHSDWGADRIIMLRLYRSIIRSKLDYGCVVYSSARDSDLQTLDSIHNTALRLCTGAFRSSPVRSLCAETGEPPLEFRRHQLLLQFYARAQQLPQSLTFFHLNRILDLPQGNSMPIGNHISNSLHFSNLPQLPVLPYIFSAVPRWLLGADTFCAGFDCPRKGTTPPSVVRNMFMHHLREHHLNTACIFTDGSKDDDKVGCSAVVGVDVSSVKLSQYASNFSAELHGIILALNFVNNSDRNSFSIFTDSKSALFAISHLDSTHPPIQQIQTLLYNSQCAHKTVSLCWCPAHVGVPLNEAADQAARLIATDPDVAPASISVPYRDHYSLIKTSIRSKWQHSWNTINGNKLRTIKDHVQPPPASHHANRRNSIILTRLRIGHTRFSHQHLMERQPPPLCTHCARCTVSVRHILSECPFLLPIRQRWFPFNSPTDPSDLQLQRILTDVHHNFNINSIIGFLRESTILTQV